MEGAGPVRQNETALDGLHLAPEPGEIALDGSQERLNRERHHRSRVNGKSGAV